MEMTDQREIKAAPEAVFAALLDPEVLKACVPGTKEISGSPEDGFEATVIQKVGPVKATFKGTVTLSDMVPGEKLTIAGEGKGGAAGFAKGGATVRFSPTEAGTLLDYTVEAKVGGKLAQLGSRLIDGFAKNMADKFFDALQAQLEGPAEGGAEDSPDGAPAAAAPEASEAAARKGFLGRLTGRGKTE